MKNQYPIIRVPALFFACLLSVGLLYAGFAVVQSAAASPDTFDCSSISTNQQDCEALVELYESTNGGGWTDSSGWLSGSPCDGWSGIICDEQLRVQQIVLINNNLMGTLPTSVINLDNLILLYLGQNQITGAVPEIVNLDSPLTALYLNENAFEGPIPASLGSLTSLEFLYLNGNKLSGAVPIELCSLKPVVESAGAINLNYNALENDPVSSDPCIDVAESFWRMTQTVAPAPRLELHTPGGAKVNTPDQLTIAWEPIEFSEGGGFYEVFQSTTPGVYSETATARTQDKTETSVTVGGIVEGQDYYFVVRTKSYANEGNPNVVTSDFSEEISNKPVALTLTDFQVVSQSSPLLIVAAALLLLILLSGAAVAGRRN